MIEASHHAAVLAEFFLQQNKLVKGSTKGLHATSFHFELFNDHILIRRISNRHHFTYIFTLHFIYLFTENIPLRRLAHSIQVKAWTNLKKALPYSEPPTVTYAPSLTL